MNMGNTFGTFGSQKFLEAIFQPKECCYEFFQPKKLSTKNFHVKLNGALTTPSRFMYNVFRMNYFPVVRIFWPKRLLLMDPVKI
jgi:hypothetical protein